MAYTLENAKKAINNIINYKKLWTETDQADKQQGYANDAKKYYDELRANGYGTAANKLQNSNLAQAQKWADDYYVKTGRSQFRPYMYEKGKQYGLSKEYIDSITAFDDDTGEVIFGGKNIGKPGGISDGRSYFDPSYLDNVWSDYVNENGISRSKESMVNQEDERLFSQYKQEFEDLKNTNPFNTAEGRAIMGKYDLAGMQGRNSQLASGAGSNGGNIDSFAAANALRQQSALVNQGQQAVLEAHQQKLDHARNLLSDMGVHIDRVYNQDETSKNNEVARASEKNSMLVDQAAVTGYAPSEWIVQNDPFLSGFVDENGKLKEEYKNANFQEKIDTARKNGDEETAKKYEVLRGFKFRDYWDDFKQYAGTGNVSYLEPVRTSDHILAKYGYDTQRDANQKNVEMNKDNNASAEKIAQIQSDTQQYTDDRNLESVKYQVNSGINPVTGKPVTVVGDDVVEATNVNLESVWSDKNLDSQVYKKDDGTYTTGDNGIDYYGAKLVKSVRNAVTANSTLMGSINWDDANEVDVFLNIVESKSKNAHVDLEQLEKVFKYLQVPSTISPADYFEDNEDLYTNKNGVQWANGVTKHTNYTVMEEEDE